MPTQPPSDRFKADMPQIPGVTVPLPRPGANRPSLKLVIGLLAVLVVAFLGARWALRPGRVQSKSVEEMAKPWSSKRFFIRNAVSGVEVAGILVRLPTGSPSRASGYWAFSVDAPYGNCRLEYVTDLARLRTEYGFAAAKHPMVGNPCNHTVFDPAKTTALPGTGAIVGGAIVQGSDLRPPLSIEIRVRGKDIEAIRTE